MAIREIRLFGDPILRHPCQEITDPGSAASLVADLLETVDMDGRAGLAANQIGVGLNAFSLNIAGKLSYVLNPKLIEVSGEPKPVGEGCLSLPDLWFKVERYPFAKVRGIDLAGREIVLSGEGLMAQALQHECDHLSGKVYIQRLSREMRGEALRQIRASNWF